MAEALSSVPPNPLVERAGASRTTAMDRFLASIERRALAIALSLLRDREDALDAVQDAMLRLVRSYGHKPETEWPPLFYRILNNRIHDDFRRAKLRGRLFGWFGTMALDDGGHPEDPWEQIPDPAPDTPPERLERERRLHALQGAVRALPRRQREAFILRCWEGLSTEETAGAMGCTQGSVKTHYFRALHALREKLEGFQP